MGTAEFAAFVRAGAVPRPRRPGGGLGASCADFQARLIERLARARELRIEARRDRPHPRRRRAAHGSTPTAGATCPRARSSPARTRRAPRAASASRSPRAPRGVDVAGIELEFREGRVVRRPRRARRGLPEGDAGHRRRRLAASARSASAPTSASTAPSARSCSTRRSAAPCTSPSAAPIPRRAAPTSPRVHWDMICDLRRGGTPVAPTASRSSATAASSCEPGPLRHPARGRPVTPRGQCPSGSSRMPAASAMRRLAEGPEAREVRAVWSGRERWCRRSRRRCSPACSACRRGRSSSSPTSTARRRAISAPELFEPAIQCVLSRPAAQPPGLGDRRGRARADRRRARDGHRPLAGRRRHRDRLPWQRGRGAALPPARGADRAGRGAAGPRALVRLRPRQPGAAARLATGRLNGAGVVQARHVDSGASRAVPRAVALCLLTLGLISAAPATASAQGCTCEASALAATLGPAPAHRADHRQQGPAGLQGARPPAARRPPRRCRSPAACCRRPPTAPPTGSPVRADRHRRGGRRRAGIAGLPIPLQRPDTSQLAGPADPVPGADDRRPRPSRRWCRELQRGAAQPARAARPGHRRAARTARRS